jgi:hypothetical protein
VVEGNGEVVVGQDGARLPVGAHETDYPERPRASASRRIGKPSVSGKTAAAYRGWVS